jgi:predicted RNA-binding protein with PUA-like domain
MKYWLVKSEPDVWSFDQHVKKGVQGWDGVRNHAAAGHLRAMKKGDRAFFYHSNIGKEIVGIVEVAREAYPDASDETGKFVMVDFKAVKPLKKPVTLAQVKSDPKLKNMALLKYSRLSVQPVTAAEWEYICKLGGV